MSRFDEPLPTGVIWWLQDGVLVVRTGARFSAEELRGAFVDAYQSLSVTHPVPLLFDNRGSQERASADEIRRRARSMSEHRNLFGPRIAVVVSDALHYGLARMGGSYMEPAGLEVMVFETPAEAFAWLGEAR